jgi:hypothetical protein
LKDQSVFAFELSEEYAIKGEEKEAPEVAAPPPAAGQIEASPDGSEDQEDDKVPTHLKLIHEALLNKPGADDTELELAHIPGQEEIDEELMLKLELEKLKTGEDAISFFAKNGSQTPIKFVYCNRAQAGETFEPYELDVVPEDKIDPEYFTISATGVVHVCPGQPCEYMSLADWMNEWLMFSVLSAMNFWKFYIHRKVFSRWHRNSRYATYCHYRSRLARSLFLAKPLFVQPLLKIHAICY